MTYELQLWNGAEYQRHESHTDPAELRGIYKRNFVGGYRIVNRDRRFLDNTTLPLKPRAPRSTTRPRPTMADAISYRAQAQAAAEHYERIRDRGDIGPVQIPVFPVKPSGRGMAADFRLELARILTGQLPFTRGAFWGRSERETREILEARLGEAGYQFVEVDLEDYPS